MAMPMLVLALPKIISNMYYLITHTHTHTHTHTYQ
jgi:hypothetical protein